MPQTTGILPVGWRSLRLSSISTVVRGSSPRPAGDTRYFDGDFLPWLTVSDVTSSTGMYVSETESNLTEEGVKYTRVFQPNTLIITNSGATLGVPRILKIETGANDGIAGFLDLREVSKEFLFYWLETLTEYLRDHVAPGLGQPNLNTEIIGSLHVVVPPFTQQEKICATLSTWDRAIEQTERLIAAKRRHKQGLMQQLLTGKMRFKESGKPHINSDKVIDWLYVKVKGLFENRSIKGNPNLPVLSVTQDQGVVLRSSLERKINMSDANTGGYKLVEPGDFVISLRSFQGGLEYSTVRGIVSPAYYVISPKGAICSTFYKHFFKSKWFVKHLAAVIIGIRDGKQVNYSDFASMKIPCPSLEQQQKIADCLDSCDRETEVLCRKLDALKEQKKGLMQQLLTGKVRVKV